MMRRPLRNESGRAIVGTHTTSNGTDASLQKNRMKGGHHRETSGSEIPSLAYRSESAAGSGARMTALTMLALLIVIQGTEQAVMLLGGPWTNAGIKAALVDHFLS